MCEFRSHHEGHEEHEGIDERFVSMCHGLAEKALLEQRGFDGQQYKSLLMNFNVQYLRDGLKRMVL